MADLNNLLGNISDTEEDEDPEHANNNANDGYVVSGDVSPALSSTAIMTEEYKQLKDLWMQELACPELLYYNADLMLQQMELLRAQEDTIDEVLQNGVRGATSSRIHNPRNRHNFGMTTGGDSEASRMISSLAASLLRMECDRVRFILADLTRLRLKKIERHALHNRALLDRMSDEEVKYLQQYGQLIEKHFNRTVLNQMPKQAWRNLDGPDMIDRPNLDEFVFCRVNEPISIENEGDETGESFFGTHGVGETIFTRYRLIREFVLEGKVTLLV